MRLEKSEEVVNPYLVVAKKSSTQVSEEMQKIIMDIKETPVTEISLEEKPSEEKDPLKLSILLKQPTTKPGERTDTTEGKANGKKRAGSPKLGEKEGKRRKCDEILEIEYKSHMDIEQNAPFKTF